MGQSQAAVGAPCGQAGAVHAIPSPAFQLQAELRLRLVGRRLHLCRTSQPPCCCEKTVGQPQTSPAPLYSLLGVAYRLRPSTLNPRCQILCPTWEVWVPGPCCASAGHGQQSAAQAAAQLLYQPSACWPMTGCCSAAVPAQCMLAVRH